MNWRGILKYNLLGQTGIKVSEVGLGGAGIGHAWGVTTDEECNYLINYAMDNGINFYDTSPVYGNEKSEINLGNVFKNLSSTKREGLIIATKIRFHNFEQLENMEDSIRRSIDRSLSNLNLDYIDLIQIHHQVGHSRGKYKFRDNPPEFAPIMTYSDCINFSNIISGIQTEGKVRFTGLTGWNADFSTISSLLKSKNFDTIQVLFNALNQSAGGQPPILGEIDQGSGLNDNQSEGSIFELCQRHNVGVVGIRSHAAGAIVNMLDRIVNKEDSLYKMHQNASELDSIAKKYGLSLAEMALIFCIKNSNITTTVPGVKNRQELNQSINCANTSVEDELVIEVTKWYKKKLKQV